MTSASFPSTPVHVVAFGINHRLFTAHQRMVHDAYVRLGFVRPGEFPSGKIEDEYDNEHATYFMVYAPDGETVTGTFRMIRSLDKRGLPFHTAYPELLGMPLTCSCEATRVVAAAPILFEAVIRGVAYARSRGLPSVVSLGTPLILKWINRHFGPIQKKIGEPRHYRGGDVIPCIVEVETFETEIKARSPETYRYYQLIVAP